MPRPRNIAAMTAQEFIGAVSMTGLKYNQIAMDLSKSSSMISKYASGRVPVPEHIRARLQKMVADRAEFLRTAGWMQPADTDIAAGNLALKMATHDVLPRLYLVNRRSTATPRQYPPYRMTHEKLRLFIDSIKRYLGFVRSERQATKDPQRVQDLDMEIADVCRLARQAAEVIHGEPPYEIHINSLEWYVVSRLLRHAYDSHSLVWARSMYQHWRKYKGLHFVKHGKYSYRGATAKPLPIAPLPVRGTHDTIDIESTIASLFGSDHAGEESTATRHRDGGEYPDGRASVLAAEEQPTLCNRVDGGGTIIGRAAAGTGATVHERAMSEQSDDDTTHRRPAVVAQVGRADNTALGCPVCRAGPTDPCRPGCGLG